MTDISIIQFFKNIKYSQTTKLFSYLKLQSLQIHHILHSMWIPWFYSLYFDFRWNNHYNIFYLNITEGNQYWVKNDHLIGLSLWLIGCVSNKNSTHSKWKRINLLWSNWYNFAWLLMTWKILKWRLMIE